MPSIIAPCTPTKPEAGVMVASPATIPVAIPTNEGLRIPTIPLNPREGP